MNIGDGSSVEIVNEFCHLGNTLSVDGDADAAVTATICHWPLSSLPKMFHCCCGEMFMMYVYGGLDLCQGKELQMQSSQYCRC